MSGDATLIYSGSAEWDAWLTYYEGEPGKTHAQMKSALAALTQRRGRWLYNLLAEIFSSDIPFADVAMVEGDSAIAIRGVVRHRFTMRAMWAVPSLRPPAKPAPVVLVRAFDGRAHAIDGLLDALRPAAPAPSPVHVASRPRTHRTGAARRVEGSPFVFEKDGREFLTTDGKNPFPGTVVNVEPPRIDPKARAERNEAERDLQKRRAKDKRRAEVLLEAALLAARNNQVPFVDDADDLRVIEVIDPLEEQELEKLGDGPAMIRRKKVEPQKRIVSLKTDPLGRMAKWRQLSDHGAPPDRTAEQIRWREEAGRFYENLYARVEIGGARGIDFTREVVDGGGFATPDTDARLVAQRRFGEINKILGGHVPLVRAVLLEKRDIAQIAAAQGDESRTNKNRLRNSFCAALDIIAGHLGFLPRPKRARPSAGDAYSFMAAVADDPEVHRRLQAAVDLATVK